MKSFDWLLLALYRGLCLSANQRPPGWEPPSLIHASITNHKAQKYKLGVVAAWAECKAGWRITLFQCAAQWLTHCWVSKEPKTNKGAMIDEAAGFYSLFSSNEWNEPFKGPAGGVTHRSSDSSRKIKIWKAFPGVGPVGSILPLLSLAISSPLADMAARVEV